MKKIGIFFIIFSITVSLTSCGDKKADGTSAVTPPAGISVVNPRYPSSKEMDEIATNFTMKGAKVSYSSFGLLEYDYSGDLTKLTTFLEEQLAALGARRVTESQEKLSENEVWSYYGTYYESDSPITILITSDKEGKYSVHISYY